MVKWLEEITVTDGESTNFYHFHDNRVLPSHVTAVIAKEEGDRRQPPCRCTVCLTSPRLMVCQEGHGVPRNVAAALPLSPCSMPRKRASSLQ